jgi:hypothetical protein
LAILPVFFSFAFFHRCYYEATSPKSDFGAEGAGHVPSSKELLTGDLKAGIEHNRNRENDG